MSHSSTFRQILIREMRRALDFRLLLFWLAASMLPTLLVALPLAGILSEVLDFSAYVDRLAQRLDLDALSALSNAYQRSEVAIQTNVTLAWLCTLLLAPMLTAMAAAIFTASEKLATRTLITNALMHYGRWFWLHLSAFVLYLLGFAIAAVIAVSAEIQVEEYVDAHSFGNMQIVSWLLALLIVLMTHFFVEIARAEYVLDARLRFPPSAFLRALARGQILRRIAGYLLVCGIGIGALLLLLLLRQRMSGASLVARLGTMLLAQCSVAALAWMRNARIFVLSAIAQQTPLMVNNALSTSSDKSYRSRL